MLFSNIPEENADEVWVLCGVFFNQYYTLFDLKNSKIGFALSNPNATLKQL